MAPTSRIAEASLGKMPTTRDRRLISLLMRSMGLVDQIFCQCALGNAAKARTSCLAASMSGPALGKLAASRSATSSQAALTASASGWANTVRNSAAAMCWWVRGTTASRFSVNRPWGSGLWLVAWGSARGAGRGRRLRSRRPGWGCG